MKISSSDKKISMGHRAHLVEKKIIATEKRIQNLFMRKKIPYMIHLSGGNEIELIEIFKFVGDNDYCFSNHRSHYHALLKGMKSDELIQNVVNGKSMHLYSRKLNFFTSSIVGGILPIALGVAMAIKRKNLDNKVWVFVGDMCSTMGIYYECLHYAEGHDLPIMFVIENNGYCIDSDTKTLWGADDPKESKELKYEYERTWPHCGTGDWVNFDNL